MSYYYEDMSYYSYTVPEHYEDSLNYSYMVPAYYSKTLSDSYTSLETIHYIDTPPYDDEDHLVPTYDDDRLAPISPTLYESEANAVTVEEGIYFEEDIHPAYREPLPPSMTSPMIASTPHISRPILIMHTAPSRMKNWNRRLNGLKRHYRR